MACVTTVAFIQWLPVLSFFFAVPLCVLFFSTERKTFVFSVLITFILDSIAALGMMMTQKAVISTESFITAWVASAFFILPLLCLALPSSIRYRYRIALSGIIAAASWVGFFALTDAWLLITEMLHQLTGETASMMYSMIPEGFERTAFQAQMTPEMMYSMTVDFLLYSIVPLCVFMYTAGFRIAHAIAGKKTNYRANAFRAIGFYNDFIVFLPLVLGMIGITIGRLLVNRYLMGFSWNIALAAGLFFMYQGFGILSFFLGKLRKKTRFNFLFGILFVAVLFLSNGWLFFLGSLLIAGVVELFIPLRLRFDNNDTVDPTPGHDGDHD